MRDIVSQVDHNHGFPASRGRLTRPCPPVIPFPSAITAIAFSLDPRRSLSPRTLHMTLDRTTQHMLHLSAGPELVSESLTAANLVGADDAVVLLLDACDPPARAI